MSSLDEIELRSDIEAVAKIDAVAMILEVICRTTGMGFAAVARVTKDRWRAASVLDKISFGLPVGGELPVDTTICDEIRDSGKLVAINHVAKDPVFFEHHTPKRYGLQSYISVPIYRRNTEFFGTLCAIDPNPAKVESPEIIGMFQLFAQLIGTHLDNQERAAMSEAALLDATQAASLREEFIAILGHDLRNPLHAISMGANLLKVAKPGDVEKTISRIENSVHRMSALVDNMLDFSRARLGGGFVLNKVVDNALQRDIEQVISELVAVWPGRHVESQISLEMPVLCDGARICQMLSNLLANALTHGARNGGVSVAANSNAEQFRITVKNEGVPIPSDVLPLLFRPYVRGGKRKEKDSLGLGLGLYIASEIAKAHSGTLTVESNEAFTAFTFLLKH